MTRKRTLMAAGALALAVAAPARADVAVTFDDGPESNATLAAPELLRDGLPATFYIISGKLGPAWGHVTAEQVRALSDEGFEVGSHTVDHPNLAFVDAATLDWELTASQATLQAITGRPVVSFAYPYGGVSPAAEAACVRVYATCRGFGGAALSVAGGVARGNVATFQVDAATRGAQVRSWIDAGRSPGVLVVLVYHNVERRPSDEWNHRAWQFKREMRYLAASGARVVEMRDEAGF